MSVPGRSRPARYPRRRWSIVAVIVPWLPLAHQGDQKPVTMREVSIRGRAVATPDGGTVQVVLQAKVATPIGRVPINGHVRLRYDCDARFSGTISYHPLVRLLAKIKGLQLVTATDGRAVVSDSLGPQACPALQANSIEGQASVEALQLSGFIKLDAESLFFRGPAWLVGDTLYHSRFNTRVRERDVLVEMNLYERRPTAAARVR